MGLWDSLRQALGFNSDAEVQGVDDPTAVDPGTDPSSAAASAGDPVVGPAYAWLVAWSPAERRALYQTQVALGLDPRLGALPALFQRESGGDPTAPHVASGTPRGGLIQLTQGANLPGFGTADAVWAVRAMSVTDQLRQIVLPFYRRVWPRGAPAGVTAARISRLNFLPGLADRPDDYHLGDVNGTSAQRAYYSANRGFDPQGRGYFTWPDVDKTANASLLQGVQHGWVTVGGAVQGDAGPPPPPTTSGGWSSPGAPSSSAASALGVGDVPPRSTGVDVAPAIATLVQQLNAGWPLRDKSSDGILPSQEHSDRNPTSDHERGDALDVTLDPDRGPDLDALAAALLADPRTTYVIWNRQIANPTIQAGAWRPYAPSAAVGYDPHTRHLHVSIADARRSSSAAWDLSGVTAAGAGRAAGQGAQQGALGGAVAPPATPTPTPAPAPAAGPFVPTPSAPPRGGPAPGTQKKLLTPAWEQGPPTSGAPDTAGPGGLGASLGDGSATPGVDPAPTPTPNPTPDAPAVKPPETYDPDTDKRGPGPPDPADTPTGAPEPSTWEKIKGLLPFAGGDATPAGLQSQVDGFGQLEDGLDHRVFSGADHSGPNDGDRIVHGAGLRAVPAPAPAPAPATTPGGLAAALSPSATGPGGAVPTPAAVPEPSLYEQAKAWLGFGGGDDVPAGNVGDAEVQGVEEYAGALDPRFVQKVKDGLLAAWRAGLVDNIQWVTVPFDAGGSRWEVSVTAEPLSVGGVRLPVSFAELIAMASDQNGKALALPLTRVVCDAVWAAAARKMAATPTGNPAGEIFNDPAQVYAINRAIDAATGRVGDSPSLWDGDCKDWVEPAQGDLATFGPSGPGSAVNYGFRKSLAGGDVWQTPGHHHDRAWKGYSQMGRLMLRAARKDGQPVDLLAELAQPGCPLGGPLPDWHVAELGGLAGAPATPPDVAPAEPTPSAPAAPARRAAAAPPGGGARTPGGQAPSGGDDGGSLASIVDPGIASAVANVGGDGGGDASVTGCAFNPDVMLGGR